VKPTKLDSPMEFIGPVDEALLLTLAVLQRNATTDEIAEFERRYVADDGFRDNVGPLVELWLAPFDLRDVVAEAQGKPVAERKRAGVPLAIPAVDALPARSRYGALPTEDGPRRASSLKDLLYVVVVLLAAILIGWGAVVGYQVYLYDPPRTDGVIETRKVPPDTLRPPQGSKETVRKKAA
jgi:hypothetical protein